MDSIILKNENSLKIAQVLKAKQSYTEALTICNKILEDLKTTALKVSDNFDAIQLMSITIGEISEIYEDKNELQCALEYKKLQRLFLSYIKYQESLLAGEPYESDEGIMNKKDLIIKLNDVQHMAVHLSNDPEEAMKQILESLQRSKERKVKNVLESISNSPKETQQNSENIELTKFELFIEFIFIHPFLFIILIIFILTTSIFLISNYFRTKKKMHGSIKDHLKEITDYISRVKDVKK